MKQDIYIIEENVVLAKNTMKMVISGDTDSIKKPGQFVNIKIDGLFLRRPISICDMEDGKITLIYKIVGQGTEALASMEKGNRLDVLVGLGNGYDTSKSGDNPVLIGGGVGIPPLYGLAKELISQGKKVKAILGFNTGEEIFLFDEFKELGVETYITTVDGSTGTKGFVTDILRTLKYTYFYTCGPMAMFKAIEENAVTSGQYSFEERMGCGFGACMGCSCKTKYGSKRICKDGPVLEREEIIW